MPHRDVMWGKSKWADEKCREAISNGNMSDAKKYSEISSSYTRAISKYCGRW